jgi:uncharacterized protein
MFPLQSVVLPGETLPLRVFEPRYSALVGDCLAGADPCFGAVLIARGREVGGGDERHDVGVLCRIARFEDHGGGRYHLRCSAHQRIRVTEWLPDDPYPLAVVRDWPDEPGRIGPGAIAAIEDIWALLQTIAAARDVPLPRRTEILGDLPEDDGIRLYALASRVPIGAADKYAVLAAPGPVQRAAALAEAVETLTAMAMFGLSGR